MGYPLNFLFLGFHSQITATEEDMLPPSEKAQTPRDDGLDPSLAAHIAGMTAKLHMSAKDKEVRGLDTGERTCSTCCEYLTVL